MDQIIDKVMDRQRIIVLRDFLLTGGNRREGQMMFTRHKRRCIDEYHEILKTAPDDKLLNYATRFLVSHEDPMIIDHYDKYYFAPRHDQHKFILAAARKMAVKVCNSPENRSYCARVKAICNGVGCYMETMSLIPGFKDSVRAMPKEAPSWRDCDAEGSYHVTLYGEKQQAITEAEDALLDYIKNGRPLFGVAKIDYIWSKEIYDDWHVNNKELFPR